MGARLSPDGLAAWRAILEAHAAVLRRVERRLAAAELPPVGWYDVLFPLLEAEGNRLRMSELSERVVFLTRTALTRAVDRVERAGLVRREPAPGDGRGVVVVLEPAGVEAMRRIWRVYASELAAIVDPGLGPNASTVARAVARVRDRALDASSRPESDRRAGRGLPRGR